jgi:LCP family protein required for cell wall assembly
VLAEIATAVLNPGWNVRRRLPPLAIALFAAGTLTPLAVAFYALFSGRNWVALTLDAGFLAWVMAAGIAAVVARLIAVADVWLSVRAEHSWQSNDAWAIIMVLAVVVPLSVGVVQVGRAKASIEPAFAGQSDLPLFDSSMTVPATAVATTLAEPPPVTTSPVATSVPGEFLSEIAPRPTTTSTSTTTTTLPPKPERPRSGVDPIVVADVTNVLLLGGDAGPGRSGLRTDTMMLFSLHKPSGRAALISIPRNLEHLLFPPGSAMEQRYPYGFSNIANAVYPIVSSRSSLRAAYEVDGVRPGVVAIAHGLGYSLDVTIHDYVLIDMQGFLELIDALGGVTVDVPKEVPMPGNVPGAPTQYPDTIGPGVIDMDGTTALGYVRSRKGDTDYRRTARQRDLLEALATQISFEDVALSFGSVASAIGGTLRTSLSPDELAETLAVIGGETAIVESVGLVPPLVRVTNPDYGELARIVGAVRVALATGQPSGY